MTDSQIEKDGDECWALWRRKLKAAGIDPARFPEIEVWHHAYRCGVELGKEIEREACAEVAVRCASEHVASRIRSRTVLLDAAMRAAR